MAKRATLEDWIRLAYQGCPPPEAYLEEELAAVEAAARERLERHAESCPACAAERELTMAFEVPVGLDPGSEREVDKIARHLGRHAPHGRRNGGLGGFSWGSLLRLPAFQLAATAVLLVGVGLAIRNATPPSLTGDPSAAVTRSAAIEPIGPIGELASAPDELAWQAVDGAVSYLITVRGVDETELWKGQTTATTIAVDDQLVKRLLPAVAYLWTVEALDAAGTRIAWSAPIRFRIIPAEAR